MLAGWGGETLLESYDYERRPASARAAEVSLKNYRRLVSAAQRAEIYSPTPEGDAARRAIGERLVEENEKILASGRRASWLHLSSVADRGAGRDAEARGRHVRLSARRVSRRAGAACLARAGQIDPRSVRRRLRAAEIRRRCRPKRIERAAAQPRRAAARCIGSNIAEAAALYERALVLVRPDGHVAWRGDNPPADALALIDTVRGAGPRIAARRADAELRPGKPFGIRVFIGFLK